MNKISQLLTAPDGYTCTGVEGEVTKIFPRSTFGADKSVQRVMINDVGGSSLKVCFWQRDEFPFSEGQKIQVMPSSQGKGLSIKDNEYKGQVTKELSVSDKCGIVPIDAYSDQAEVQQIEASVSPTITTAENQSSESGSMLPAILVQQANLMDLCMQGAQVLRGKYPEMTNEQFQAITSSFYIECNKQNVGKTMPSQLL